MNKKPHDDRPLFLFGQTLSQLMEKDPKKLLALLCEDQPPAPGEGEPQEQWKRRSRAKVVAKAASQNAPKRVALVCAAGRGKTTNMQFMCAHIAAERDGKQIPFLFRLDRESDLLTLEEAIKDSDTLLAWMAAQVQLVAPGNLARHRWALERYLKAGRITLLLDGLDHVMGRKAFLENLARLLNSPNWSRCPLWISGRREAFKKWAKEFFDGGRFRVLQVDPLEKAEIEFFMAWNTGRKWHDDFPPESQDLLATPRTLGLICRVLRTEMPHPPEDKEERKEKIRELELDTGAGVYHRAYFHVGLPSDPNSQGLLAQGLRGENERMGTNKPSDLDFAKRVQRMGLVLGAIAFYMFGIDSESDHPEPNTTGIDAALLFEHVGAKLEKMGHGTSSQFADHLNLLRQMNNHALEFMLFGSDISTGQLVWHNRTVQAFFAAHWAMRYGSAEDLALTSRWIIDKKGRRLDGFDEFWQFAAEMPDRALRTGAKLSETDLQRWRAKFGPCYQPPAQLTGKHEWVQWHRQMIFYTFRQMRSRSGKTIEDWRVRTAEQAAIVKEIVAGFRDIPAGPCHYGAEPATNQPGRLIEVPAFRMHEWPVTNRMYEAFDPAHRANRWKNEYNDEEHPLVNVLGREGEDYCPVVNVTWYDAWCFAVWCGDDICLPSDLQWEHACRKGTAWDYYFEGSEAELPKHAWFDGNSEGHTHPVPAQNSEFHRNGNGLYDMHGNVWEWCASLLGGSARVIRGGSWSFQAADCSASYRERDMPADRRNLLGFRLLAVPSKQRK